MIFNFATDLNGFLATRRPRSLFPGLKCCEAVMLVVVVVERMTPD